MYIPMLDPVIVGKTVAFFRNQKGVSQEVLSGLATIGRSHLSAIERGERKPTLETLYRICCAIDIKMSTFILKLEEHLYWINKMDILIRIGSNWINKKTDAVRGVHLEQIIPKWTPPYCGSFYNFIFCIPILH